MSRLDFNFLVLVDRLLEQHPGSMESGYRTEIHNRAVGGATQSAHKQGNGQDLIFDSVKQLLNAAGYAVQLGFSGIEVDLRNNHLHVDTKERAKTWHVVKLKSGKEQPLEPFLSARLKVAD